MIPASGSNGQEYQVSYGMHYVTGGPNGKKLVQLANGTSNVMIVWDHARTPGCANSKVAAPRGPWTPFVNAADYTHYPVQRHGGVFNVLYSDGNASPITQSDLQASHFYAGEP